MRWTLLAALIILSIFSLVPRVSNASDMTGIPPKTVADYIHAVIEADRTFYTIHVVERLQKEGGTKAAENWRSQKDVLPLPAQFLAEASDLASKTGTPVRYRLISLWPINPQNGPRNETEKSGLEAVRQHPERAATNTMTDGNQQYFQAIYADYAVAQACVSCHNAHPRSPRKDFKLNDVLGGLVIEIPIGK